MAGEIGINRMHFEIFVGDIHEEWDKRNVLAKAIMNKAGVSDTANKILEALDKRNGDPVKDFQPDQLVDLSEADRKFFRISPGGGGFS